MQRFIFTTFLLLGFLSISMAQENHAIPDSLVVIDGIELKGNKTTIDRILLREITLKPGDTISYSELRARSKESQENLMNTSLFNFATIKDTLLRYKGMVHCYLKVEVVEQWYIWPLPIFELAERNFNAWWETKDMSLINYGLFLDWRNFRGRKEHLKIILQLGYDEKLGFSYSVPYIDKKQTIGLSFGFHKKSNHKVSYITENNKVERIALIEKHAQKGYEAFLSVSHRASIYQTHHLEASYNDQNYADTIFEVNPDFYHGDSHRAQFFKLSYYYKNDHRDYKSFPLKGYYIDFVIENRGFGVFEGNDINLLSLKTNLRKFWKFHKRVFFGAGFTGRIANKREHPYFLSTGLGYGRDFVRGYEYYVVDGQDYVLLKTDFKFAIIPQQTVHLKFLPAAFGKIPWAVYLSLYSDMAYSPGDKINGNTLKNELLIGYGAGINVVTYYDMVIRMEYSFNKMGEGGFFIHFMASI